MNIEIVKNDKPPKATHWCKNQEIYIDGVDRKWFDNGEWRSYNFNENSLIKL